MAVRHSGAALARYRPSLWSDFVALWPEVDKPPFPEEPDMVEFYHAREAKVGLNLNQLARRSFLTIPLGAHQPSGIHVPLGPSAR